MRYAVTCAFMLFLPTTVPAQSRDEPQIVRLTVDPAPEPVPALKYRLLPEYLDKQPGNAAPYYYRALVSLLSQRRYVSQLDPKERDRYYEWTRAPIEELPPTEEIEEHPFYKIGVSAMGQLRTAAYREYCDWDLRLKDLRGTDVIEFLLPEFQESRELARFLSLKAAMEIREGRFEDALETLRIGLQLARDVAKLPTLINDLVGIAIASMMHERLVELVEQPKAPNLYWAATALPDLLIDLREALEHERAVPYLMFPVLRDAETAERSAGEWLRLFAKMLNDLEDLDTSRLSLTGSSRAADWDLALGEMAIVMKGYPQARQRLIGRGYTADEVEQMPVAQVLVIDSARTYDAISQDIYKWSHLPFPAAMQAIRQSEQRVYDSQETFPIARNLIPPVRNAVMAEARLMRRIAMLRTIEALRLYSAEHGEFPKSLDEITQVVVPDDPVFGRPFGYRWENGKVILTAPVYEGRGRVYEITLRE